MKVLVKLIIMPRKKFHLFLSLILMSHYVASFTTSRSSSSTDNCIVLERTGGVNGRTSQQQTGSSVINSGGLNDGQCFHRSLLPPDLFRLDTCAWCYHYMNPLVFGTPSKKLGNRAYYQCFLDPETGKRHFVSVLKHNTNASGEIIFANRSDPESPIWQTFPNKKVAKLWTDCCQAAEECCQRIVSSSPKIADLFPLERKCPQMWDGWQCWNSAKAGETGKSYCPHYIYFLTHPPKYPVPLEKECLVNGTWAPGSIYGSCVMIPTS